MFSDTQKAINMAFNRRTLGTLDVPRGKFNLWGRSRGSGRVRVTTHRMMEIFRRKSGRDA